MDGMISNKNVLKKEILEYLRAGRPSIGWDIIKSIGKESHNVRNALSRLRRNNLVDTEKVRGGPRNRMVFQYTITKKGVKRLSFYQEGSEEPLKPRRQEEKLPTTLEELAKISKEPAKHEEMRKWTRPKRKGKE